MNSASTDSLLKGIGCNMSERLRHRLFPEECLVELSKRVLQDFKALVFMCGAVQTHGNLLHPEMLLKCLINSDADFNVIGSLLLKTQDRRFSKVIQYCRESRKSPTQPLRVLALAARTGQSAFDAEFRSFGIHISELPQVSEKKITSSERLLRQNVFFQNRVLFGSNWRADIISCIQNGLENPSKIKKRLRCSYETAHRVFNDYLLFQQATARAR
jgi:hypothetical protein